MMTPSHLDAYHALLATRRDAAKRDMILMGVLSVVAVATTTMELIEALQRDRAPA
jgi:hypothetical protein